MTLDKAIQHMLFNSTDRDLEDIAYLARKERDSLIMDYQANYGWTFAECEEFIDNAVLAYEMLVKNAA